MRLSHSRIDCLKNCKKWFYMSYVLKVPAPISDTRHLRRGSTFHEVAEYIIKENPKTIDDVHNVFLLTWNKYKLDTDFAEEKDKTYLMLLTFFKERPILTSTEYKIFVNDPEFLGYIDGLNTNTDTIIDYKTSVYYEPDAYKDQLGRYSLFYWKQFGRIPKCEVWYVKYAPFRKTTYVFTVEEMLAYEKEIREVNDYIEKNIDDKEKFPCADTCHVFCPYKTVCDKFNEGLALKLTIENSYVTIFGEISPLLNKGLKKKFSYELKDAFWIKKNNPMANTWVRLWDEHKHRLPIGFLAGLLKTLRDYAEHERIKLTIAFDDKRKFNEEKVEYKELKTTLRNYQLDAVESLMNNKITMLEIATGGGKSLIMVEPIRRLGHKTLIVVTRLELLKQLKGVIEKELDTEVGVIGGSVYNPKHITIATIQTLAKNMKTYSEFLASIRFSIIDECHHINKNSFWRLGQHLINTEYRLGTSGTARRFDGHDMFLTAVNGHITYNLSADKLIEMGFLVKPQIIFIKDYLSKEEISVLTEKSISSDDSIKNDYNSYYENFIMNNNVRNNIIKQLVEKNNGKQILIITKRIDHANNLAQITGGNLLYGNTEKDIRQNMLEEFKEGNINVLIGTIGIFQEGLDIVNLDVLINATGNKSDIASIQVLGRLLRKSEKKNTCIYYDFIDESRYMKSASKSRIKAFKDEKHDVEIINSGEL